MRLSDDIIMHIYSFLPIVDEKVAILNKSILNMKPMISELLLTYYYNIYISNDIYLSWLLNDIERWMNQDIATMNGYTDKYIEIIKKTANKNLTMSMDDSMYTKYWSNLYSNPKKEIKTFINRLSHIEVIDLYKFIIKIRPHNNMFSNTGEHYISSFYSQTQNPLSMPLSMPLIN